MVDDAVKTFFERRGSKIDEQSDGKIHQAEIGQDLFAVNGGEFFHGLEFHDYAAFHEQVGAEAFIENHPVVFKANDLLPFDMEFPLFQSPSQHRFINRFQQPRPKVYVNLERRIHNRSSDVIEKKRVLTRRRGGRGGVFRCRVHKQK